jgi:CheY-like chemotaxis protein
MDDRANLNGTRVLVVEDEFLIAMEIEAALEAAGAIVVGPAPSLEAACSLARNGDIDAAILDVNLGDEHVFPAAELLDQRGIPYIFHTAYPPKELEGRPVCVKPVEPVRLIRILCDLRRVAPVAAPRG